VDLHIDSPIRLHGVVLNLLSTATTLALLLFLYSLSTGLYIVAYCETGNDYKRVHACTHAQIHTDFGVVAIRT
jgi:hypothetical protein